MKHFIAKIISHVAVSDCFFELTFTWDTTEPVPLPGQFCTIRVSPYTSPLLRRPFAFSAYNKNVNTASILYKKRGPATELLCAKTKGDDLDIIGCLGSNFLSVVKNDHVAPLCVAGGTGFGPMAFLCDSLIAMGKKPTLILGCRTKAQVPLNDMIASMNPLIATDDGSMGKKGTPLTILESLTQDNYAGRSIGVCGPLPLMRGCHDFAQRKGLACFVSMEQMMACGVGACMGCAVKITDANGTGYVRACTEGPVFNSARVAWI